jgi:ribosomal protein S18 acetylase RimI-like enzyme
MPPKSDTREVVVRFATVEDVWGVAAAHHAAAVATYKGIMPKHFLQSLSVEKDAERMLAGGFPRYPEEKGFSFVAEDAKKKILGYIQGGPCREAEEEGEIYAIYLHPSSFGTGVASALWEAGTSELSRRGFDTYKVWVIEENPRARRFYEKLGGKLSAARKLKSFGGKEIPLVSFIWP